MWRTVSRKIVLALAIVLLTGMLSMLIIYRGLSVLQKAMHELADVKEPISAAAYEMEININGIGLGVLKYLDTADPTYREMVHDDEKDFAHFYARYLQLIHTQEAQALGTKISRLYNEFKDLGQHLMSLREEQEVFLHLFGEYFERIDALIDNELQAQQAVRVHDDLPKLARIHDLESDIAEVSVWLLRYQMSQKPEDKQHLLHNEQEFRDTLSQFKALRLSEEERRWTNTLEGFFNQAMTLAHQVLALKGQLRLATRQFVHMRSEIDAVMDEEIQPLALTALVAPRREADEETARVIRTVLFLLPIFILAVIGVMLWLIRTITRPVQSLMHGTRVVSQGDLTYRLRALGRDEFGALAEHFNHMVAELQATTVSKALLQASEATLQETVDALRREMSARVRTEEESARLQASLRRSEIMAAMGSLVAGVAHEVRNPLFAISSTLDAFEARFADRQDYQRHLGVLRAEVRRLTALMQALLEYGKPLQLALVPDTPEEALAQALHVCLPLARRLNVRILPPARRAGGLMYMDRHRLVQVFQNLLDNAIQHAPAGECVVVEAVEACLDGRNVLSYMIKDSGPGFHPADLPRVFEPFFTRRPGGTGLGLSIVQRIVEEHGGSIVAGNRAEGGAIIVVRFPLIRQRQLAEGGQKGAHGTAEDFRG